MDELVALSAIAEGEALSEDRPLPEEDELGIPESDELLDDDGSDHARVETEAQKEMKRKLAAVVSERIKENQELLSIQEKVRDLMSSLQKLEKEKLEREAKIRDLAGEEAALRTALDGGNKPKVIIPGIGLAGQGLSQGGKRTLGDALSHIKTLQAGQPQPQGGQPQPQASAASAPAKQNSYRVPSQNPGSGPIMMGSGGGSGAHHGQPPPPPSNHPRGHAAPPVTRGSIRVNPRSAPAQLAAPPGSTPLAMAAAKPMAPGGAQAAAQAQLAGLLPPGYGVSGMDPMAQLLAMGGDAGAAAAALQQNFQQQNLQQTLRLLQQQQQQNFQQGAAAAQAQRFAAANQALQLQAQAQSATIDALLAQGRSMGLDASGGGLASVPELLGALNMHGGGGMMMGGGGHPYPNQFQGQPQQGNLPNDLDPLGLYGGAKNGPYGGGGFLG